MLALPLATLVRAWNRDLELPNASRQSFAVFLGEPLPVFVAATTFSSAAVLVIVILHMLAN